ncbi:MAG: chalcone isomerase family protein [Aquabacterium sp.]
MMYLLRKMAVCILLLASTHTWAAVVIKGARFNDSYQLGNQTLSLNGAGIRVKLIVDVYAAGLYVPHKEHNANGLVNQPGPKSMQIVLLRDLTGEDFADAMVKGFRHNNTEADVARFHDKIDEIRSMMASFGSVRKGTTIRIDFVPGTGVQVLMDGVIKGAQPVSEEFFSAVLRIWLGSSPVDSDLKDALLGPK